MMRRCLRWFRACGRGQRGAAPLETLPGALPLDPAKGLRPSRLPFGWVGTWIFPCRGHGARRARRDAGFAVCRCGGGEGAASVDAGRGLCDRPLHSFAPYRLLWMEACHISRIIQLIHPEGAKVSKGRRLASGESAEGGSRKRSDNDRKALWGVRLSSPVATTRKPNESAKTSDLWPRRLRLRTPPQRRNPCAAPPFIL